MLLLKCANALSSQLESYFIESLLDMMIMMMMLSFAASLAFLRFLLRTKLDQSLGAKFLQQPRWRTGARAWNYSNRTRVVSPKMWKEERQGGGQKGMNFRVASLEDDRSPGKILCAQCS